MVFGKDVELHTHGKDKHGRMIADVLLPNGTNVNQVLVKQAGAGGIENSLTPTIVSLDPMTHKMAHNISSDEVTSLSDRHLSHAPVAQWIEHQTTDLGVTGSTPVGRATYQRVM